MKNYYFVQTSNGDWDEGFANKKKALYFAKDLSKIYTNIEITTYEGEPDDEKAKYIKTEKYN